MQETNGFMIRRPTREDWHEVLEILEAANFHRIGGPEMCRFEPEDCFVADLGGQVIGVAGYRILGDGTARTTLLTVAPGMRRRGVGSALQNRRLAYLKDRGMKRVYTNCDDPAVVAWNCRQFGFRPTGRILAKQEDFGRKDKNSWTNLCLELDPDSRAMLPDLPGGDRKLVHELTDGFADEHLRQSVQDVIDAMRKHESGVLKEKYSPAPDAEIRVSEDHLAPLLDDEAWVSDIVERRELSNCIAYNFDNVDGAVMDNDLAGVRQRLDAAMLARAQRLFPGRPRLTVENTGHFWYPPGCFMGWHTNLRTPGWRCYISVADAADRSFFRYRDPSNGEIVTSWDRTWNVRLFHITPTAPLWHAVYSGTHRFSLGYKLILD